MEPPKLGSKVTEPSLRDALHVPVVPLRAGEKLRPGQRVRLGERSNTIVGTSPLHSEPIGIVDPFLDEIVERDETVWVLMMPGTTQNVRHEWKSKALEGVSEGTEALFEVALEIARICGVSTKQLYEAAEKYCRTGEASSIEKDDFAFQRVTPAQWEKFWLHFKVETGLSRQGEYIDDAPYDCCLWQMDS